VGRFLIWGLALYGGYDIARRLFPALGIHGITGALGAGRGRSQISRPGSWYLAERNPFFGLYADARVNPKSAWAPPITSPVQNWDNVVTSNVRSGYFRAKGLYERSGG
jgi:hypothetical protein